MTTVRRNSASDVDRTQPSMSNTRPPNESALARLNQSFFLTQPHPLPSRPNHYLDDTDVLTLRRQYDNMDLLDHGRLSNSAEDLSQLDRYSYPFDIFGQDLDDPEEDDVPFGDGSGYDYDIVIQERLRKANEEFQHDQTPLELKHPQSVSFDAVVKAVDIIQHPAEHEHGELFTQSFISTAGEVSSARTASPSNEPSTHEYTVPLNDTQPRQGPTLLQQLKAMQFYGAQSTGDPWSNGANHANDSHSSIRSNENDYSDYSEETPNLTTSSTASQKSMIVAINGRFDLQHADDYTAKDSHKSTAKNKVSFLPKPPSEPKPEHGASRRVFAVRPKSSDSGKRVTAPGAKASENKTKSETNHRPRPKSAGLPTSIASSINKTSSGVDFDELVRKAAEKKRALQREEQRQKQETDEKRRNELAKAKESFNRWMIEKNAERKRIDEEKRSEKEEHEARQAKDDKQLAELRKKKYKQWIERKNHQAMISLEFKKLQADEEELASDGSSTPPHTGNHRAFQRWLRRKYEESMQAKRQLRLESKRQRRSQRRSIKRHQLHQDLQLAKTFGYS